MTKKRWLVPGGATLGIIGNFVAIGYLFLIPLLASSNSVGLYELLPEMPGAVLFWVWTCIPYLVVIWLPKRFRGHILRGLLAILIVDGLITANIFFSSDSLSTFGFIVKPLVLLLILAVSHHLVAGRRKPAKAGSHHSA